MYRLHSTLYTAPRLPGGGGGASAAAALRRRPSRVRVRALRRRGYAACYIISCHIVVYNVIRQDSRFSSVYHIML